MAQLHKKFIDSQVRELIERYLKKEIYPRGLWHWKNQVFCFVKETDPR